MPKRRFATFGPPPRDSGVVPQQVVVNAKPVRKKKPKVKNDPKHVAAARELRDRYLEQFNAGLVLPNAKYDVGKALPAPSNDGKAPIMLPHAA